MTCNEIQELILTDYLDGQMNSEEQMELEAHLTDCGDCRKFEAMARKRVIEPFRSAKMATPPEALWHQIKERIEQDREDITSVPAGLIDRIRSTFSFPKPAFVAASTIAVLLVAVVFTKLPPGHNGGGSLNVEEPIEYVAYLMEGAGPSSIDETEGFGTLLEEYFL